MSEKKNPKTQLYTLPVEYAHDLITESEEQISAGVDLLINILSEDPSEHFISPIVIEILWSNISMERILSHEMQDPVYHTNESTDEEEYVVTEDTILGLQAVLLSRYYANIDLNRRSYSLSMN
tara:strand:+ start:293 stop:661 length:369 start_codon:yes stop_codon:yes gene_type:complete